MCRGARWDCNCFITYNEVGNLPPIYNGEFGHGINHRFFRDFRAATWIFPQSRIQLTLQKIQGNSQFFLVEYIPPNPRATTTFCWSIQPDNTPPRLPDCPETIGLEVKVTAWLVTFLVSKRCWWSGQRKVFDLEIHLSTPIGRIANFVYVIAPLLLEINSSFGEVFLFYFFVCWDSLSKLRPIFLKSSFSLGFFLHVGPLGALFWWKWVFRTMKGRAIHPPFKTLKGCNGKW